jgi:hypothetical protein
MSSASMLHEMSILVLRKQTWRMDGTFASSCVISRSFPIKSSRKCCRDDFLMRNGISYGCHCPARSVSSRRKRDWWEGKTEDDSTSHICHTMTKAHQESRGRSCSNPNSLGVDLDVAKDLCVLRSFLHRRHIYLAAGDCHQTMMDDS